MSDATPGIRSNPEHDWYVALQRVRMTAKDALMKAAEQDPATKSFLSETRALCDKLLTGANPKASIASSLAGMVRDWAPQAAQQLDTQAVMLTSPQASAPPSVPGGLPGAPLHGAPSPGPGPFAGPPSAGAPSGAPGPGALAQV